MKIEKRHDGVISDDSTVQVIEMNHLVEVQYLKHRNTTMPIQVLDKNNYLDLQTGEIKEFNHIENRSQLINSIGRTFKELRYYINNNFTGNGNELHVTLTYAENMTDPDRLYDDFKKFMIALRRKFKTQTTIDFINVVEPQGRGAWHCHVLLRFNELDTIFIKNEYIRRLWKQGFVSVKSLNGVDNIGAYLSAYLTDVELTPDTRVDPDVHGEVLSKKVDGIDKKFIKGGRLHMYPPGMRIYRCSRGIKKPDKMMMKHEQIKKVVGSAQPHYSQTIIIKDDDDKILNTIVYNQYNLKRYN